MSGLVREPLMTVDRRFVFHGHATAYSGWAYRPKRLVITSPAAAALSVSGGKSIAERGRDKSFAPYLESGSSTASVTGSFDDSKAAVAMSDHKVGERALASTTVAAAEVHKITAMSKRVQIEKAVAAISARSEPDGRTPSFHIDKADVRGVVIDGCKLDVVIDRKRLDEPPALDQKPLDGFTLVTSLRWRTKPPEKMKFEFDGHGVYVDGLGWIYFGEVLVSPWAWRLTMVRFRLGSDASMHAGVADVGTNGSWYPPVL